MRKGNKQLGIYLINKNTLRMFVEANRLSAFKVYTIIKDKYSGSIHPKQYKEIAKLLERKQVDKQIRQLQEMGVLRKRSHNWLTITKRMDFCPSDRNPSKEVNILGLLKIHELRKMYYEWADRKAYYMAKMNVKNNPNRQCSSATTPGLFQMSSSFIKNVSQVIYSERTINKWLHILRRDGVLEVHNTQQTVFDGTLQKCRVYRTELNDEKTFIRKTIYDPNNPLFHIEFPFRVVKFLPNMIKFCKA